MKAITDIAYFKGEIAIPFQNKDTSEFTANYVQVYEEDLLVKCLGRELFDLFAAEVDADVFTQRFSELLLGKYYEVDLDGKAYQVKWEGFKNSRKISPLAHYIFTKYVKDNYQQFTGLGNVSSVKENATDVDIRHRVVPVFKSLEKLVGYYPYKSDYVYNVIYPQDVIEEALEKTQASLFNFLYFNREQYPEWIWTFPDVKGVNFFDL